VGVKQGENDVQGNTVIKMKLMDGLEKPGKSRACLFASTGIEKKLKLSLSFILDTMIAAIAPDRATTRQSASST
jgi:hypothetical protein